MVSARPTTRGLTSKAPGGPDYDVNKCLAYNKGLIDQIVAKGWHMNFMRLHMDPYWSNQPWRFG